MSEAVARRRCLSSVVCRRSFRVGRRSFVVHRLSPVVCRLSCVVSCSSSVVYCLSRVARRLCSWCSACGVLCGGISLRCSVPGMSVFDVLRLAFSLLCGLKCSMSSVDCSLRGRMSSVLGQLCSALDVRCSVFCVLYVVFCVLWSAPRTLRVVRHSLLCVSFIVRDASCIVHEALSVSS